jgi:RHS repeat-associated protein
MPFGLDRYTTGSLNTAYRYTGQRIEDNTDLYFYQSRWYDPVVGRFLQPDSIVPEPGNPQALNRYTYVYNNPLRYVDSSGHTPLIPIIIGLIGLGLMMGGDSVDPNYDPTADFSGSLGTSIVLGDALDILTLATGQDYLSGESVSHFSSEWWRTACLAALPVASGSAGRLLSDTAARKWYNDAVKQIDTNLPLTRESAEQVHAQRNALKRQARDLMADRDEAARLDLDYPLQDFDYYVDKYTAQGYHGEHLWERIMQGGTTTNPAVNQQFGVQ